MVIEKINADESRVFDVYKNLRQEAGDDLWPVSTLAAFLGVKTRTLRAQFKAGHIPTPQTQARNGNLTLQLYTRDECVEIQNFYDSTYRTTERRIDPTVTLAEQPW